MHFPEFNDISFSDWKGLSSDPEVILLNYCILSWNLFQGGRNMEEMTKDCHRE